MRAQRDTWIIVCEHFDGAVGPVPTERLASALAVEASKVGGCTYRPVRLALAHGPAVDRDIRGDCDRDNPAMVKAFERAGFQRFARRRTFERLLADPRG